MKLKNWKDNINCARTFMNKSFQRVWNSFWALFHKWVTVVEMKIALIWLVLQKEERKVMTQMNNDSNQQKESLKFNDMIHYYLFVKKILFILSIKKLSISYLAKIQIGLIT